MATHEFTIKCTECGNQVNLLHVKKDNQNKGRPFYSCSCANFFIWADMPVEMDKYYKKVSNLKKPSIKASLSPLKGQSPQHSNQQQPTIETLLSPVNVQQQTNSIGNNNIDNGNLQQSNEQCNNNIEDAKWQITNEVFSTPIADEPQTLFPTLTTSQVSNFTNIDPSSQTPLSKSNENNITGLPQSSPNSNDNTITNTNPMNPCPKTSMQNPICIFDKETPPSQDNQPIEIKFDFYDENYLIVRGYYEKLVKKFWRGYKYSTFSPMEKGWKIPLEYYEHCIKELKKLDFKVTFNTFPPHIIKLFANSDEKLSNEQVEADITTKISSALWNILMPFQKEGVIKAIMKGGRVLIGDEMGLGKTLQALTICSYYDEWPVLVICPSSLRLTWSSEIQRWLQISEYDIQVIFHGSDKLYNPMAKFVIISYDLCRKMGEGFRSKFKVVVADEAHYLKNRSAQRSQISIKLIQESSRAILLTGTPALSRAEELFSLLGALNKKLFSNFNQFANCYCDRKFMQYGGKAYWNNKGSKNLKELHWVLAKTILIRRLKKDVELQLPKKTRAIIKIKIDKKAMKPIAELKSKKAQIDEKEEKILHQIESEDEEHALSIKREKQRILTEMWETTAVIKMPGILEYVKQLYESTEKKFLVFAHHQVVLDGCSREFEKESIKYVRIDGSVPSAKRQALVDQFQNDSSIRIALLSITAANTGLTLTAADLVVFAELYWTPAELLQAEDRAHRIGRNDQVDIKYILADGTADDILWPLVKKKLQIVGLMLDNSTDKININEGTTFGRRESNCSDDFLEWMINETEDAAAVKETVESLMPPPRIVGKSSPSRNIKRPIEPSSSSRGVKRTQQNLD
ncbi:12782_t:CDS:10, partial [Ambispora gerdemannii]